MKTSVVGVIVIAALVLGFGAGFALRPILVPAQTAAAAAGVAQPTEAEATAAVRRHKLFVGSLDKATLKLGDCSPGGISPGVTCMTQLTIDPTQPNPTPQNRTIGFARVNGQWEVAVW